jgi:electron transfer DM13
MDRRGFVTAVVGIILALGVAFPAGAPIVGTAQAAQAVRLASGQFGGWIDAIHRAEGHASVYRLSDGSRVLRLENFKSTNGPNLYVYLSGDASPRNSAQLHENGDFEVGRLKGNIGNQNYTLPSGVDLSKFKSVVIYCKQFHVVFGSAELAHN